MGKATRQEMKKEALKRMSMLKLLDNVIKDFDKDGKLYYSERMSVVFDGILYWVDNNKDFSKYVKDFEKESGYLVYHCQLTHTSIGDMFAMLFVSNNKADWAIEDEELEEGYTYANVINLDDDSLSEMGSIGVKPMNGGITRTA